MKRKDIVVAPLDDLLNLLEFPPKMCAYRFGDAAHDIEDNQHHASRSAQSTSETCEADCAAFAGATTDDVDDAAMANETTCDAAKNGEPPALDDAAVEDLFAAACLNECSYESSAETIDESIDEPTLVAVVCRCPECEHVPNVRFPSALRGGPAPRDGAKRN